MASKKTLCVNWNKCMVDKLKDEMKKVPMAEDRKWPVGIAKEMIKSGCESGKTKCKDYSVDRGTGNEQKD